MELGRDGFIFIYLFGSLKSVFGIVIYIEFILLLPTRYIHVRDLDVNVDVLQLNVINRFCVNSHFIYFVILHKMGGCYLNLFILFNSEILCLTDLILLNVVLSG